MPWQVHTTDTGTPLLLLVCHGRCMHFAGHSPKYMTVPNPSLQPAACKQDPHMQHAWSSNKTWHMVKQQQRSTWSHGLVERETTAYGVQNYSVHSTVWLALLVLLLAAQH